MRLVLRAVWLGWEAIVGDLYTQSLRVSIPDGPGYLELNDGANIRIVEWNPPLPMAYSESFAESEHQAGRLTVTSVRAEVSLPLAVRVYGTTWANQQAWVASLQGALTQRTFTLTEVLEGVTRVWQCRRVNGGSLGEGGLDPFAVNRSRQVYVFLIPGMEVLS